jgi:hypothetical protein
MEDMDARNAPALLKIPADIPYLNCPNMPHLYDGTADIDRLFAAIASCA